MTARTARRLAWAAWSASLALGVLGAPVQAAAGFALADVAVYWPISAVMVLGFSTVGLLIASRQPGNALGWVFLAVGFSWALSGLAQGYTYHAVATRRTSTTLARIADWSGQWSWMPVAFLAPTLIALLFPNGRPLSRRWGAAVWVAAISTVFFTVTTALAPGPLEDPVFLEENPFALPIPPTPVAIAEAVGALGMFAAFGASVVSLLVRLRGSRGEERQQMKWLVFALLLTVAIVAAGFLIGGVMRVDSTTVLGDILIALVMAALALIPVAAGIAILRYRLWDIDVVINKTVVFGALAAFITIVYVGVVVGVGSLLGRTEPDLSLQVAATAVVAIAFHPVRERARRLANRLVYGERAEPYEVLVRFASRAAGTYATEDVLPRTARVIGEGTGAARAEVWLSVGQELRLGAGWPEDTVRRPTALPMGSAELPEVPQVDRVVPVEHRGELLGAVAVAKPPGEPLTPAEDALLRDLAKQAGLVLRNARLTEELRWRLEQIAARAAELRASRQRIVAAHDAERRRLERNIHDGAQQHLVALAVKLRLARDLLSRDAERAAGLLQELRAEIDLALATLRDLAGGIYPAVLEERGIVAALETQARLAGVPVRVEADGLARRPIETEAAVYFSCLEALQNAVKHAGASEVRIQLAEVAGHLSFSVRDDGRGFDPEAVPLGAGLRNMADRVEAFGGRLEVRSAPGSGTTVEGEVPIQVPEAVP